MKLRLIAALLTGFGLSACAAPETATRNVQIDPPQQAVPLSVSVEEVVVHVPRTLKVSEANRYFPEGDIVWREDAPGDRHAQVQAIVEDAMTQGVSGLSGARPAVLDIEITRFHALSEKARFSTGGVHAVHFIMTLRDPATGQPLSAPREIKASLKEFGGQKAIEAMQRGETQKVRITRHLAEVIRTEIAAPGSYHAADLGMFRLFQ